MGTTPNYTWPYPELTDKPDGATQIKALANAADSTLKAQVAALQALLTMPAPVSGYVSADQTITSVTRYAETPTQVRAQIVNPHATKRLMVRQLCFSWAQVSGLSAASALYFDPLIISGATPVTTNSGTNTRLEVGTAGLYTSVIAESYSWIAAGGTGIYATSATRSSMAQGGTCIIRYVSTNAIPLRYE